MDLKDFYRLVIRNMTLVLISTIVGVAVAGVISLLQAPVYQAKIQLFVSTQSSQFDISSLIQGSSFSQQRVKSYAQIIPSPTTLEPVIKKLKLNISPAALSKQVKATAPLDTVLIDVTVSFHNPKLAADVANAIGNQFSKYVNKLELSSASAAPAIKVSMVKKATIPTSPSSPKVGLNILLGLILGFGLGVGLSIMRQIFDGTVKNEENLNGLNLLGTVGFDPEASTKPRITQLSRYAARTEAFRQLRTKLQYINTENPPKIISVTSALPSEGKSSSALNLAFSLAQTGFDTLLIEGDLRRPKCSRYLGLKGESEGLSEILGGNFTGNMKPYVNSITRTLGGEYTIDFIGCGKIPANPSELLDSSNFDELLKICAQNYSYVIIDTPPTLPVADASIVAAKVDGTLVVVKAGKTRIKQLIGVQEAIANVGGNVIGVLLNMIPITRAYDDYGYKYGYGYRYKGYKNKYGYKGSYDSYGNYAPEKINNESN